MRNNMKIRSQRRCTRRRLIRQGFVVKQTAALGPPHFPLSSLVILILMVAPHTLVSALDGDQSTWYTRYPHYPPYCSTPEEMATRKIPEMPAISTTATSSSSSGPNQTDPDTNSSSSLPDTRILHVTAILRHGARTPWGNTLNCWQDYWTNPATAVWDCPLATYLSPPPPDRVAVEEHDTTKASGSSSASSSSMFLFEKRYDAFSIHHPEALPYYSNQLNGTCQLGQLLLQGYQQELTNGQHLRKAYVYHDNDDDNHNPRMKLLPASSSGNGTHGNTPNIWDQIYYRVDDEARTLMSGQIVLRGLLGPELEAYVRDNTNQSYPVIPLHTADYDRDVLDPNEKVCPKLKTMRHPASSSFNTTEADLLQDFQHTVLQVPNKDKDMDAIDCLMTTICTDRPLPDAVNDYVPPGMSPPPATSTTHQYGTGLFSRLVAWNAQKTTVQYKANQAEYAKLAMAPLWYEIMQHVRPHVTTATGDTGSSSSDDDATTKTKLSIVSGHDTTVMPILIALDENLWNDTDWPSYASMITLEIHEIIVPVDPTTTSTNNNHEDLFPLSLAFRLSYNGRVLTDHISDCPSHELGLCDIQVLLDRTDFATVDRDCGAEESEEPTVAPTTDTAQNNLTDLSAAILMTDAVTRTEDILSTPEGILYLLVLILVSAMMGALLTCCCCFRGNAWTRCLLRRRATRLPTNDEADGIHQYDDDDGML